MNSYKNQKVHHTNIGEVGAIVQVGGVVNHIKKQGHPIKLNVIRNT